MKRFLSRSFLVLACGLSAWAKTGEMAIHRDGWTYDRSYFRESAEQVATARTAGKGFALTGWSEYDVSVPKTGWYELWLGGCPAEWPRSVYVDGRTVTRLQVSSGTDKLETAANGVQFKELNLFLTAGSHTLRFQRLSYPGILPGVWELRLSDGGAGSSLRASVEQSRIGEPGSTVAVKFQGGGTGVAASYELFWRNEADGMEFAAGRIEFAASEAVQEKTLALTLPAEGLYSLQAKAGGAWLRPSDLKAGYFLTGKKTDPTSQAADLPFQLGEPYRDGVILQREKPLPVWGWGKPGEVVTVALAGQTEKAVTAKNGRWKVIFKPLKAGGEPLTLSARTEAGKTSVCKDVQVGEVWLLSGQSNMGGPLLKATGGLALAEAANQPDVRLALVREGLAVPGEISRIGAFSWSKAVAAGDALKIFAAWNAIPFAFGTELSAALKVPVGLISANRGGTYISTWSSRELHEREPSLRAIVDAYRADDEERVPELVHLIKLSGQLQKWRKDSEKALAAGQAAPPRPVLPADIPVSNSPGQNYRSLIEPMGGFAIRGVLWYQGESDSSMAEAYGRRFPLMIQSWRELWGDPAMPFLYVQIAYGRGDIYAGDPVENRGAELKDVQLKTLHAVPRVAMAVTNDLMKPGDDVHYPDKIPVGHRLALAALATVYGRDVPYSGPVYKAQAIEAGKVRLTFDFAEGLAASGGASLGGFTVAGEDRKWFKASAVIEGDTVVVSSPGVPHPVAVRYSWADQPSGGNLVNGAGLPSPVFRTDDWPMITAGVLWEQKN